MLKLFVKTLMFIAVLALSGTAAAVGMGGINVTSALGEPLNAEIELADVGKADKNRLSARLASPEAFKGAGLDYSGTMPKLKFQIETRANGETYIKLTSALPVNDPFVNLLVELTWSSGRLLREYTFLLDPPGFKPEQPKAAEVQPVPSKVKDEPIEPSAAGTGEAKAAAVQEASSSMSAPALADQKTVAAAPSAAKPAASGNAASGTITVKHGDTLSKIARETKVPDVSLERMLVAMYRVNEDVFDDKNMNRLRTGKILRVPEEGDLNKVAQADAVKEIHAQAADWHDYRMKLAANGASVAEEASRQEASGKIGTTVTEKTPAARQSAKEVVRLSKGEAPGDKAAAGGNAKALQDRLHVMEEDAIARNKALKESNERIAILEKNIKEMQRLLELKGRAAPPKAAEVKPEAKHEAAKPAPVAAPAVIPASAVAPVKPTSKKLSKIAPPPPSLLDQILDEPLYLAGGAVALLGLGGIMLARRRGKGSDQESGGEDSVGAHIAAPVAPSPDTGDFTHTAIVAPVSTAEPEDADPISEAELFLNFGRDVQAEEILKDALKKSADNQQIRLKLLSIYAMRKDAKTFSVVARQVQDSGDAVAWAIASEMGRKIEPGNPMYGGGDSVAAAPAEVPADVIQAGRTSLDLDLGLGVPEAGAAVPDATSATSTGLDFDLGLDAAPEAAPAAENESDVAPVAPQGEKTGSSSAMMDFDLGLDLPTEAGAATDEGSAAADLQSAQETPMDFDITSEHPELSAERTKQAEESAPGADELNALSPAAMMEEMVAPEALAESADDMAFTLDFPVPEEPAADDQAAPAATAIDLSEINLNVGAPAFVSAPAEEVKDARWHDVATKLDLAKAYQEMGDASGASEILQEVLSEGDAQQRAAAEIMLQQLSA